MKRILTSALAIVLFVGAANAQQGNKQDRKEKRNGFEMALKGADLSADQQNKVKTINENYRKQMADLRTQNLSADQTKVKRQALQQQHVADIQAVLTAEQKAKMLDQKNKNGADYKWDNKDERAKKGMKKGSGNNRNQDMKDLNLSADQQARIKTIREGYKAKILAVRNDGTLSEEARKEKVKSLMQAQQMEVKAILTPDQQSKIKEDRKGYRNRKN